MHSTSECNTDCKGSSLPHQVLSPGTAAMDLGEEEGSQKTLLLPLLETRCRCIQPEEVKSSSPSGSALGPSRWQSLDQEPYQDDFGDHSCPQLSLGDPSHSSCDSRTMVSYPCCSSYPQMELFRCPSPLYKPLRWWDWGVLPTPQVPAISLCSQAGTTSF